jgi:hypothetical protein
MVECTWVRELLLTRRAIAVLGTCASQSNSCGSVSSYESRSTQLKGMWIVHALHCLPAGRRCVGLALAAVTPLHASIQFAGWLGMQRSNWGSARSASACMVGWFISEIFRFPFFLHVQHAWTATASCGWSCPWIRYCGSQFHAPFYVLGLQISDH